MITTSEIWKLTQGLLSLTFFHGPLVTRKPEPWQSFCNEICNRVRYNLVCYWSIWVYEKGDNSPLVISCRKNAGLNWNVYDLTTGVFKLDMLMITIGLHSLILCSISLTFIQGHSTNMMFDYVRELTAKKLHKYPEYRSFWTFPLPGFINISHRQKHNHAFCAV